MKRIFGTDGVRGIANTYPMTAELSLQIGQAVAYLLRKKGHRSRIIIGKDTRLSGYMIENSLLAGIASMGADTILVGPMPTPGIAFITTNMDADAGIVISASHNPFQDNGIKIFTKQGFKLSDEEEHSIEKLITSGKLSAHLASSPEIGKALREEDASGRYIVFLKHTFPRGMNLEGIKIVVDCANGATYKVAPTLFKELRAETLPLNITPNGKNINLNCGTLHAENIAKTVVKHKADIGIVFDGDGDRFIAIDEKGTVISGDKIMAICAARMKEKGTLTNNLLVSTVMSNMGLSLALKSLAITHHITKVGDRHVLEAMVKQNAVLGGEDSGHIIFREYHTTGDGILAALQLLAVMRETNCTLSTLAKIMKTLPQIIINIPVARKSPIKDIPEIQNVIKKNEEKLAGRGRVLVRYSGTQSMCRVMVEGPTQEITEKSAKEIARAVRKHLN